VRRIGPSAAAAAGTVACTLASLILDNGPPDTSTALSIQAHYAAARARIEWSELLFGFAAVFMLFFLAKVAQHLRGRIDAGAALQGVILPAGAVLVALQLGFQAAWFTLARQPAPALTGALHEAWLYHDLGDSFAVMGTFAALALVGAATIASYRGAFPRWVAHVGAIASATLVVDCVVQVLANESFLGNPMGLVSELAFLAWVLCVGFASRDLAEAAPTAAPA
jgi:Domain of unknown function (DUF4386)